MLFGLINAAQAFQRCMDGIFHQLDLVILYLDEILIASFSDHEHFEHILLVIHLLSTDGVVINQSKLFSELLN